MQVFEFYFNPKLKTDMIFDSFCYEPENIYERKVGSLYLVGVLKNALPKNFKFLEQLSKTIKEKYYSQTLTKPEKSLKESLKRGNEFLENLAKSGDVSWLGNLSFAVLSLKNYELNFTKVGDLKILLLRGNQLIDIDKKLKFQEIEPYPLKIFGNIVSGKLAENDLIFVLTKDVFDCFLRIKLFEEIAQILPFDERKLRGIFDKKSKELSEISGVCFLIFLSKLALAKKREFFSPKAKEFTLKEVFSPFVKFFKKNIQKPRLHPLGFKFLTLPKIKFKKIIPKKITIKKLKIQLPTLNKNIFWVLFLILVLLFGFFIFQKREEREFKNFKVQLEKIQEKVIQAENYLTLSKVNPQAGKNANLLLKESLEEIEPILKIAPNFSASFEKDVLSLKEKISTYLYQLNKLEKIEEPELFFEFTHQRIDDGLIPQKIIFDGENLYLLNPYSQSLFKINQNKEGKLIQIDKKFNLVAYSKDLIFFFSKPDKITPFQVQKEEFLEPFLLAPPYSDFSFTDFTAFESNLYFLDEKLGEIVKYPAPLSEGKDFPQLWLSPQTKKATEARAISIDGTVWILKKNNTISRYYTGKLQEILELDFFPYPKHLSRIFTSAELPYLYILEPVEERIIILTKSGRIVKQIQSLKFDNLLDFAVSKNGKTIWLLNGLKIYQVKINI